MVKNTTSIQSVDRALKIMDILQGYPKGLGVTELSRRLEVSKSTSYRLLTSLKNQGYIKQDEQTELYLLGHKLIHLGQKVLEQLNIRELSAPYLRSLSQSTGETAHLAIMEENRVVYIDKIESPKTIRMFSNVGKTAPLHCTGVGKAILAFQSDEKIKEVINGVGLKKFTDKTIVTKEKMLSEIDVIRRKGYSIDDEEHELGITCAASPILNHNNQVVAGISVAGPTMRIDEEKLQQIAKDVVEVCASISKLLGSDD
ncbi:putative HTH-type transcriptional regulator YagI [Lentibacillus sp. JNUCC-1]|uniref:IclR family transcriptional regulator n=1 Tax=Lentibacillus sp. JNUCC-1 TaxID=2654513 RepID=UPI0012E70AA3|nr:IclR family transcriptional regulator [Lentibacillus sp. JNUCC-1]MUV37061.1 putative HTH-type transcriptional regulator YagI [Lentibacillus sp. JNUCC-1]